MLQLPPLGKVLSLTGKGFLNLLNEKLNYLDIDRDYYALILIELGEGNLTQKELANQLESDKVSVVRIVDYLTEKGYVKRIKNFGDKRKYSLTLTEKAREKLPGIKKSMEDLITTAFTGISESQQAEFISMLGIIKDNIKQRK
jgi:DNA-binding MarR family transcriptional regulator